MEYCINRYFTAAERREREPDDPESIERRRRDDAIRAAIDCGEDLGVIRQDEDCFTTWIGTWADLIATDACRDNQFPVAPKRTIDGDGDGREGVESWRTEAIRRGYFEHTVWWDTQTTYARRRAQRIAHEREGITAEAFAERCETMLIGLAGFAVETLSGKYHKARYTRETIEKVGAALEHARQLLQSSTPVIVRDVAPAQARVADIDPAFARFMAATFTPAAPTRASLRNRLERGDRSLGN